MKTDGRIGSLSKSVVVISSDPKRPRARLTLKGNVIGVGCRPSKNVYFYGMHGLPTSKEYTIFSLGEGAINVKIISQPDFIETKVEKIDEAPPENKEDVWSQYKLIVNLKPDTPPGKLQGKIVLETSSSLSPRMEFRVMGQVRPSVTADPTTLRIWLKDGKPVSNKTCKIKKHTSGDFKILKINPSVQDLAFQIKEVTPGKIYQIEVEWKGEPVPTTRKEFLQVETDDKNRPSFKIPVVISPRNF